MRYLFTIFFLATAALFASESRSSTTRVRSLSDEEHYSAMVSAIGRSDWWSVALHAQILAAEHPSGPYSTDTSYYLAIAHFNRRQYYLANEMLNQYLTGQAAPRFFESAIQHKFQIC